MKVIRLLLWGLSLIAFSSCDDEESLIMPEPDYELLSIEYEILEIIPENENAFGLFCENLTSEQITNHFPIQHKISFMYFFSPEKPTPYQAIEVPLPRIDITGSFAGYSDKQYPYQNNYRWDVNLPEEKTFFVPPQSTVELSVINLAFRVTANYLCEIKNLQTGETEKITGTWYGQLISGQQTLFKDKFGEHISYKPVSY